MRNKWALLVLCFFPATAFAAPEVVEVKSASGITAWLIEEHSQPVFSVNILFKQAGAISDPKGKEGRSELATELLTEGAGEHDALAFATLLEEHAIRLRTHADEDRISISLKALSSDHELAFSLLTDVLARPRYDRDAIDRVRKSTLASLLEAKQEPGFLLGRASAEGTFGTHPYARPTHGTEASLPRITRADLQDFSKAYLTRENIIISVAGDITPEQLTTLLDKNMTALPEKFTGEPVTQEAALPEKGARVKVSLNIPQTMIRMVLPGIKREDPEYLTAYVLNYILGDGSLNSRLGKEIREKRGLAYGVSASLEPMDRAGLLSVEFSTRTAQAEDAIKVATQTIDELRTGGITEAELKDAKQYLTGSFVLRLDSNAELASLLSIMQLYSLGMDYLDKRNELIKAVTKTQIAQMADRLLQTDRLMIFTVGTEEKQDAKP